MRTRFPLTILTVLALAAVLWLPARADEEATSAAFWSFDVEVVMVFGAKASTAESVPDWGFVGGAPYTRLAWGERLARLKRRGATQLLLDAHTTALAGAPAQIRQNRAQHIRIYDRSDVNNEFYKATTVNEGVTVKLVPHADRLDYEVQVQWALPRAEGGSTPLQGSWVVEGLAPLRPGEALVLSHREQVPGPGDSLQDVEIYAFLTPMSFAPSAPAR